VIASENTISAAHLSSRHKWANTVQMGLTLMLVHYMLAAAGHVTLGSWQPFVTLADGVHSAEQIARFTKIVAIVNVSILISIASTWLGVSIATAVKTWEFLNYLRKQRRVAPQPASLQLL